MTCPPMSRAGIIGTTVVAGLMVICTTIVLSISVANPEPVVSEWGKPIAAATPELGEWRPGHYHADIGDPHPVRVLHFAKEDFMVIGTHDSEHFSVMRRDNANAPWETVSHSSNWINTMIESISAAGER